MREFDRFEDEGVEASLARYIVNVAKRNQGEFKVTRRYQASEPERCPWRFRQIGGWLRVVMVSDRGEVRRAYWIDGRWCKVCQKKKA